MAMNMLYVASGSSVVSIYTIKTQIQPLRLRRSCSALRLIEPIRSHATPHLLKEAAYLRYIPMLSGRASPCCLLAGLRAHVQRVRDQYATTRRH